MKTYRNKEIVSAYRLEESERLVTRDGVRDVDAGTWVLYGKDGVRLMDDDEFRAVFGEWDDSGESGLRDSGESEPDGTQTTPAFSPLGRSVDDVTEYLRGADAAEIARVKAIESASNKPRKGVMEFPG